MDSVVILLIIIALILAFMTFLLIQIYDLLASAMRESRQSKRSYFRVQETKDDDLDDSRD